LIKLPRKYRVAWSLVICVVAIYYVWQTNAAANRFVWSDHLDGYYDSLARGFLHGHLYMDVEPRPDLLALPDPWKFPDNVPYRLLDAVLYKRHYYLYHGATPALLLFAPWRLITRHDLPQPAAVLLLSLGGFLLLSELLIEVLSARASPPPLWLFVLFCFVLGLAPGVPFLLLGSLVYEVPIASGFFFLSGGYLFLFRAFQTDRALSAALAGVCFGLAVGSRPHVAIAIVPALLLLFAVSRASPASRRSRLTAFVLPILLCGIAICAYNYARFGNVLEFGLRYQLGHPSYLNITLSPVNLLPGLYYMLACAPAVTPVFPFFRLTLRQPFNSVRYTLPERYFHEPIAGAIYVCPLILVALAAPLLVRLYRDRRPVWSILIAMYSYAIACVVFIALMGLSSQRFEVDFLPFLVLISCILAAEAIAPLRAVTRLVACVAIFAAAIYAVAVNVSIATQGFVDEWLRNKPEQFVRIAAWFSPVAKFRPLLNPRMDVKAYFQFQLFAERWPEHPLIVAGEFGSRYALYEQGLGAGRVRLTSEAGWNPPQSQIQSAQVSLAAGHGGFDLVEARFDPRQHVMFVYWNGQIVLRHRLDFLITAPSQIKLGLDDAFLLKRRFPYQIVAVKKEIRAST